MFHFSTGPALTYEVSRWSRYLYDARYQEADGLQEATREIASTVREHRRDERKSLTPTEREAAYEAINEEAVTFGAEVFSRLYDGPDRREDAAGWSVTAHGILDELPEWSSLRESVAGDPDFSALATREILPVVAQRLPGLLDAIDKKAEEQGEGGEPGDGEGQGEGGAPSEQLGDAGTRFRAALRRAVAKAAEVVAEAREAMAGLAPSSESAPPTHAQKDPARLKLAQHLLGRPDVRDVLRKAGKLTRLAQRKDLVKDPHARGEVVGVERGSDIARVLPSELALLADPDLDVLFFARHAEQSLQQYRLQGKEPMGMGPIVLLLDESGSMEGANERWSKAAALATLATGRKERRDVVVAFFQTRITGCWLARPDGTVDAMNPGDARAAGARWGSSTELALEMVTRSTAGGTNFSQPLAWAMDAIEGKHPKADVVFVTDGWADASPATLERLQAAKGAGLRVYGLTVGGGSLSAAVKAICTSTVDLDHTPDVEAALAEVIPTRG